MLFPSWPALVLLLWACILWLIPRITPKQSLYYTSPLLVLYGILLLLLQYVHSLDLTHGEWNWYQDVGRECETRVYPGRVDCQSSVLAVKVRDHTHYATPIVLV